MYFHPGWKYMHPTAAPLTRPEAAASRAVARSGVAYAHSDDAGADLEETAPLAGVCGL
jgi:hypothetical protein